MMVGTMLARVVTMITVLILVLRLRLSLMMMMMTMMKISTVGLMVTLSVM